MNPIILRATTLIKGFEGCRLTAYLDAGNPPRWTIGWGSVIMPDHGPAHKGATITQAQADDMLSHQVGAVAQVVQGMVHVQALPNQIAALISLTFNVGSGNLRKSRLLSKFNAGRVKEAADEFLTFDLSGGKKVPGLDPRRAAERAVFLEGVQ